MFIANASSSGSGLFRYRDTDPRLLLKWNVVVHISATVLAAKGPPLTADSFPLKLRFGQVLDNLVARTLVTGANAASVSLWICHANETMADFGHSPIGFDQSRPSILPSAGRMVSTAPASHGSGSRHFMVRIGISYPVPFHGLLCFRLDPCEDGAAAIHPHSISESEPIGRGR
jgi:hypothetical protein